MFKLGDSLVSISFFVLICVLWIQSENSIFWLVGIAIAWLFLNKLHSRVIEKRQSLELMKRAKAQKKEQDKKNGDK